MFPKSVVPLLLLLALIPTGCSEWFTSTPPADQASDTTQPESTTPAPMVPPVAESGDLSESSADPVVQYDIQVQLDPDAKSLHGHQTLIYTNHSPDIIEELQFHLYMNAFKDQHSIYARETRQIFGVGLPSYGSIALDDVAVNGRQALSRITYPHQNQEGTGDETVATLPLDQPLFPGEQVSVFFDFTVKLPENTGRSGYIDDFFFIAQWFPKIGVWEPAGHRGRQESGWNCHPHHALSEFYADFGRYRITMTLPSEYVVGATGIKAAEQLSEDGTQKTLTYIQDRVHDFAWTAWPGFEVVERVFSLDEADYREAEERFGLSHEQAQLPPTRMILLIRPEHRDQTDRHFQALREGIKWFGWKLGPYPYESMTMVDPPREATGLEMMEYPTLVSLSTHWWQPEGYRDLEDLILHEFAHQYFQSMIATNEFEDPWLDEGFVTYTCLRALDVAYGRQHYYRVIKQAPVPLTRLMGFAAFPPVEQARYSFLPGKRVDPIHLPAWGFNSGDSYYGNVYEGAALTLFQLERELGEPVMDEVLRTYFERWSFKHPGIDAFRAIVNEVSGRDMNWFFDALIFSHGFIDYAVMPVRSLEPSEIEISTESDDEIREETEPEFDSFEAHLIEVRNLGTQAYPVTIEVRFTDGEVVRRDWDGTGSWHRFRLQHPHAVESVSVDPENKLILDFHRANNTWRAKPDQVTPRAVSLTLSTRLQHLLQILSGAF
ncbi:M1 family metallopeptidase [Sulfidibacter corallicola]|uniref:M1 family metallopeptidase n=1 Tax=Sulfidibacter corallicola TaxID=2818388 RepID=A0A8A4TV42_SULCO|nr:M1 family metallopeptidase [Sulfidibacter corallicola]QTD53826.1 M1 family metallopeptidase [Sulfidibacter corallicola]